jgi:hypothetical protein
MMGLDARAPVSRSAARASAGVTAAVAPSFLARSASCLRFVCARSVVCPTSTSYTDSGLVNGTKYYDVVTAVFWASPNLGGESAVSGRGERDAASELASSAAGASHESDRVGSGAAQRED